MKKFIILLISLSVYAKEYDFDALYKLAIKKDPRMKEFNYSYMLLENKLNEINSIFTPKLSYKFLISPMAEVKDKASGTIEDMDFSGKWGVGLVSDLKLVQAVYTFGKWSTSKKMIEKGKIIYNNKKIEIKQKIKYDLLKAYNGLLMINEIEKIISKGKKNLKKALDKLKELELEDSDEYKENDLFRIRIYEKKLLNKENEILMLKKQLRFALFSLLNIEKNFKIKYKKLEKEKINNKFNFKKTLNYKILKSLLDINKLNLSLSKRFFAPNIFIAASWYFKYSNVAPKQEYYNPYHSNSPGIALGLKWDFDYFLLKAKYDKAEIEKNRTLARIEYLDEISKIKNKKLEEELNFLNKKVENLEDISKNSKKWFTGNAMDYFTGLGKAEDLLSSLASYLEAKSDVLKAIYDYNLKIAEIKLFKGEL